MESQSNLPAEALDHELAELLQETEDTLAALRAEISHRREQNRVDSLADQHAEIARLSEHLANARVRWEDVRSFLDQMIAELREEKKQ